MDELTRHDLETLLDDVEWGRWGPDDQSGRANLITPEKVRQGTACVVDGLRFSLSRPLGRQESPSAERRACDVPTTTILQRPDHGLATDFIGTSYHGVDDTHVDALCHVWGQRGMWNGRDPAENITSTGAHWADVAQWSTGLITRGVLVDVPNFRGTGSVRLGEPVQGEELRAAAAAQGVAVEPGDALVVYCGRDVWTREHGPYRPGQPRPGLHASCLRFLKEADVAVLVWDAMDAVPNGYDMPWTVHAAIWSMGLALIDNAFLEELAAECGRRGRWEFMFLGAPLVVPGGTGSPINPIAVL